MLNSSSISWFWFSLKLLLRRFAVFLTIQRTRLTILGVLGTSTLMIGCTGHHGQRGILVIAVQDLRTDDIPCGESLDPEYKGFNFLCQNFDFYQGLVANSTATVTNMASLLTSLNPDQHGVRLNDHHLSVSNVTLAERLLYRNWRTSFFSGGAPLLRRTHLDQGYENFDEGLPNRLPYRPLEVSLELFWSWFEDNPGTHLVFITANDLLYPEFATNSDKGEIRSRSIDGQIEEFDEGLSHFFVRAKKLGLWKDWWIVVVGLSGRPEPGSPVSRRATDLGPASQTVPLFIHSPGQTSTAPPSQGLWTFTQIGNVLEQIALAADSSTTPFDLAQVMKDHNLEFATSEGCALLDNKLSCQTAAFSQNAWLNFKTAKNLDTEAKRALYQKLTKANLTLTPPPNEPRSSGPTIPGKDENCIKAFRSQPWGSHFTNACPSLALQNLKQLIGNRQSLQIKSDLLRDQKIRFIRDWLELQMTHHLTERFYPQGIFAKLNVNPSQEFLTMEAILSSSDLRDLHREAERSTSYEVLSE